MKTLLKENDGGGLQIEYYDDNQNIISVVTGLEFGSQGNGINDLKTYGDEWDHTDVGGSVVGYHEGGNHAGEIDENGEEYTANDMIDDNESIKTIAIWDGEEMTLYIDNMGHAGHLFFGIK